MTMATYSPEGVVFCSKARFWSMTHRMTGAKWLQFRGSASDLSDVEIASTEELSVYIPSEAVRGIARLDCLTEKRMETSPANVACMDPIDTSDSKEFALEEDPELAGDLHDIILDKRVRINPAQ